MGSLDDRDLHLIAGARRRAVRDEKGDRRAQEAEQSAANREANEDVIDIDRDPAPELPKMITLPRDVALATLRDVQDFSFRRRLWGARLQSKRRRSAH